MALIYVRHSIHLYWQKHMEFLPNQTFPESSKLAFCPAPSHMSPLPGTKRTERQEWLYSGIPYSVNENSVISRIEKAFPCTPFFELHWRPDGLLRDYLMRVPVFIDVLKLIETNC